VNEPHNDTFLSELSNYDSRDEWLYKLIQSVATIAINIGVACRR